MSKLLLYCTKAKPMLRKLDNYFLDKHNDDYYWGKGQTVPYNLNSKIVAECDFEVEEIENNVNGFGDYKLPYFETDTLTGKEIEERSCLSYGELKGRLQNGGNGFYGYSGYAIHIKNLHIFDEPGELGKTLIYNFNTQYIVEKAPKNMMKVYNRAGECLILISIRPEWLCKILNNEKTIEVRKKVLKEMLLDE